MTEPSDNLDVLILSMEAYPSATRARKTAQALVDLGHKVEFLGMSRAGRTGRWAPPGVTVQDGVTARLVDMRAPATEPTRRNQLLNIVRTYVPAFWRMARRSRQATARVVIVSGTPLLPIGLFHHFAHRSILVLDVAERPGAVAAKGSAMALFSKVESSLMTLAKRRADLVTVAVEPDVKHLRRLGFKRVELLRNAPPLSWRAAYVGPADSAVRFVSVGSIFEGRGYEMLIRAAAQASIRSEFQIDIYGVGREGYVDALKTLTNEVGAERVIRWRGSLEPSEVSSAYLAGHVGLVLYESSDAGNDGLSNKILECVSTGRPVLAGDMPENRRFVTEFGTGWVVEMETDALRESLIRVAAARSELAQLSGRCRTIGDEWLNWDREFMQAMNWVLSIVDQKGK